MDKAKLLRLERIEVDGLFHLFDHHISLNLDHRVTLLHGPNGVGKTVVLRMVNALLQERFDIFRTIPFSRFSLEFQGGATLALKPPDDTLPEPRRFTLELTTDSQVKTTTITPKGSRAAAVAARVDHLQAHESGLSTWVDTRDAELLTASDVISRYDPATTPSELNENDSAEWFSAFLEHANAYLIEAQRLVHIDSESADSRHLTYGFIARHRAPPPTSAVVERSLDFRKRLDDTMAQYGRQSQTLDQSFPQRLISATDKLNVDELQQRLTVLERKTAEFIAVGILDKTPTQPLPVERLGDIDSTQSRVMTLYVSDTEHKLLALEDLAKRTGLLLDIVNNKYRHKRIRLDREMGFVAENDVGGTLPLGSLSSGEQHEIVLHYDLLFRVPANTIVLIDEPELSLHVAWQKRFLPDLLEIVGLSDFDAIVATHSPFIIGDRHELMVGLGSEA